MQLQESVWRKNLNSLERVQSKKVSVASNNVSRAPAHGNLKELIVLRIATSRNSHINFDPLRLARQSRQKTANIFLI